MAMLLKSSLKEEPDARFKFESPPTKRLRQRRISEDGDVGEECHFDLGIDLSKSNPTYKYHDNKPLRNERGQLVLQLFRENPTLYGTSSTRLPSALAEREGQWGRIAEEINDRYSGRLSPVSSERVKKIHMYYRKREAKMRSRGELFYTADDSSPNDKECSSGDELGNMVPKEEVDEDFAHSEGDTSDLPIEEIDFASMNDDLHAFLKTLNNHGTSSSFDGRDSASPSPGKGMCEDKKMIAILRKERAHMVDGMAKYYLQRLCFDGNSASLSFSMRTSQVNQERHQMWKHITEKANKKYAEQIGTITIEQTKKLFSNLKRKSRAKRNADGSIKEDGGNRDRDEDSGSPDDVVALDDDLTLVRDAIARDSALGLDPTLQSVVSLHPDLLRPRSPSTLSSVSSSKTKREHKEQTPNMDGYSSLAGDSRLEEILKGLDKTMEINHLKEQLVEKDAEIERWKKRVAEQAEDYRKRTQAMLDLIRVAVDRKAADDVTSFLRI